MRTLERRRFTIGLGGGTAVLVVLLVLSPGVGTEVASFGWWDAWRSRLGMDIPASELARRGLGDLDGDGVISTDERLGFTERARYVGFELRLARSLVALQVGAALALCGAVLQVLFRNPLAEPYTLGISGGGSLGALLCIRAGWVASFGGLSSIALCSFIGSVSVVIVGYAAARGARRLTANELLLGGVATGLFCGALMMLVTALSNQRVTFEVFRWMMGSLDPLVGMPPASMVLLLLPSFLLLLSLARALNQYRAGDEPAAARGVRLGRLQAACILATTLATAAVVARCGPIGFVGLVVPQIVRLTLGGDCRVLFPGALLAGAVFLILCDWGSQLALRVAGWITGQRLGSGTLPIGVITALVGVPVLVVLLRANRRR